MRFSDRRNADLDEPHSNCPDLVLATDHVQHADEIIQREQHVPYRELWLQLRSSEGTLSTITQQWEYRSMSLVCSTTVDTRTKQKKQVVSSELDCVALSTTQLWCGPIELPFLWSSEECHSWMKVQGWWWREAVLINKISWLFIHHTSAISSHFWLR